MSTSNISFLLPEPEPDPVEGKAEPDERNGEPDVRGLLCKVGVAVGGCRTKAATSSVSNPEKLRLYRHSVGGTILRVRCPEKEVSHRRAVMYSQ